MSHFLRAVNCNHFKEEIENDYIQVLSMYQKTTVLLVACASHGFGMDVDKVKFEDEKLDDLFLVYMNALNGGEQVVRNYIANSNEFQEKILGDISEFIDLAYRECIFPDKVNYISVTFDPNTYWELRIRSFNNERRDNVYHGLPSHKLSRTQDSRARVLGDIRKQHQGNMHGFGHEGTSLNPLNPQRH